MQVGKTRPVLRPQWLHKTISWRCLAHVERIAAWPFYLFHTLALFRFVVQTVAISLLIVGALGVWEEFRQRDIDRGVRIATLSAQLAQMRGLPEGQGLGAMKPMVEGLVRDGVPMGSFDLTAVILIKGNLHKANFTATMLKHALLPGADLSNANLDLANICNSDLTGANISDASLFRTGLSYARLRGTNFRSADLRAAFLNETDLREADFSAAKLVGADFRKARLMKAILTDADFTDANLRGADLRNAVFTDAVLYNADLTGADLREAIGLKQRQLQGACAAKSDPPQLPHLLTWKEKPCSPREVTLVTRDCYYHVDPDRKQ